MKIRIDIACLLVIVLCALSCGCGRNDKPPAPGKPESDEQVLRSRAKAFGDLLIAIPELSEPEAKSGLEGFIEPVGDRVRRVEEYHSEFSANSKKFRVVRQSIEEVLIHDGGLTADVTYRTVARMPGGEEIAAIQRTLWTRVEGVWYRAITEPEKRLAE